MRKSIREILHRIEAMDYTAAVGPHKRRTVAIAMSAVAGRSIYEVKVDGTGPKAEYLAVCMLARMVRTAAPR